MFEVGFAVDRYCNECAFVAAHSFLINCPISDRIIVSVFSDRTDRDFGIDWNNRFKKLGVNPNKVLVHKLDSTVFQKCKGFFGSQAAYHRIQMPHYASCDRFLYVDADVIFRGDVTPLLNHDMEGAAIALVFSGMTCSQRDSREWEILKLYGKKPDDPYCSSGLAVIDVELYKKQNVLKISSDIADNHPEKITMYDQTIWNCALSGVSALDPKWCQNAFPSCEVKEEITDGLIHFAGSPKPWDLLAEFFHPYYEIWSEGAKRAGYNYPTLGKYFELHNYYRAKRISKQYNRWF